MVKEDIFITRIIDKFPTSKRKFKSFGSNLELSSENDSAYPELSLKKKKWAFCKFFVNILYILTQGWLKLSVFQFYFVSFWFYSSTSYLFDSKNQYLMHYLVLRYWFLI